jgi:HD-GYP domain-containing protein (c-di-GMP phosphodiesterase class II)
MNDAALQGSQQVIRLLLSASANASLYSAGHPQVVRLGAQLFETLSATLEEAGELTLMVIENELIINGRPQDFSLFLSRFSQILKGRGIEHIKILRGVTRQELEQFIVSLSGALGGPEEMVPSEHLRFGYLDLRLSPGTAERPEQPAAPPSGSRLPELSRLELERFSEIYQSVRRQQKLQINGIVDIVSGFVEVFRQEGMPLLVLAALRESDEYTFTHSTNVCILNLAQAMALGIGGQQLKDIGVSAMLHDIGKLFIPEEIITKKGKLTDQEFALMQEHPARGARFLLETAGVPRMAAIAAFEHHARYDLGGYPKFAPDWRLNLCSQLTMISDFFDATRTRRSYREPLSLDQITSLMLDMAGEQLHPVLTQNFLTILGSLKHPS